MHKMRLLTAALPRAFQLD